MHLEKTLVSFVHLLNKRIVEFLIVMYIHSSISTISCGNSVLIFLDTDELAVGAMFDCNCAGISVNSIYRIDLTSSLRLYLNNRRTWSVVSSPCLRFLHVCLSLIICKQWDRISRKVSFKCYHVSTIVRFLCLAALCKVAKLQQFISLRWPFKEL